MHESTKKCGSRPSSILKAARARHTRVLPDFSVEFGPAGFGLFLLAAGTQRRVGGVRAGYRWGLCGVGFAAQGPLHSLLVLSPLCRALTSFVGPAGGKENRNFSVESGVRSHPSIVPKWP